MPGDRLKTLQERTRYDPSEVESRVFARWEEAGVFSPEPEGAAQENHSIAVPPPNVTGALHMGHALNSAIQDLLIRRARMRGQRAKWIYGTDHAGIGTQVKVEQALAAEGKTKEDLGREEFVRRVWEWRERYGGEITAQYKALGCSLDYADERFTMDDEYVKAVVQVFTTLYEKGLVYRDNYMVNWDPGTQSAISDLEVVQRQVEDTLYLIDYPLASGSGSVTVATVRPETMLADTAIAVNPADERYTRLVGEDAVLPLVGRRLPIVADEYVKTDFGTGALKITPGHDPNDFEIGRRHGLDEITVIGEDGRMSAEAGERFAGLTAEEARREVVAALRKEGLVSGTQPYTHDVPHSQRSGRAHRAAHLPSVVLRHGGAGRARDRRREGRPPALSPGGAPQEGLPRLAREHPPLVHLAPAVVGPPDPSLVQGRRALRGRRSARGRGLGARPRRARHLVLLGPVAVRHPRLAGRTRPSCAPSIPPTRWSPAGTSSSCGWPGW